MRGWSTSTFIANLRLASGNVGRAAELTVISRAEAYLERRANPEFREQWDAVVEAMESAAARAARRRFESDAPFAW